MKIIIIGGTGEIGRAVCDELNSNHDLIIASRNGNHQIDIADLESIKSFFNSIGQFDALICTTGAVTFKPLDKMVSEDFQLGLNNKLMGQINCVLEGLKYINPNGSITLTSGIISRDPIPTGSSAAMVNGAIDSFVCGAAIEMPKQCRINSVSPTVLTESLDKYAPFFPGFESVAAARVAKAFRKSVEGKQTGQVYRVG